jgi:hypothetical protein
VPLRPAARGNLSVGDIPDKHGPERVLLVPTDRGAPLATDELLAHEGVERLRRLTPIALSHGADSLEPEDLPENGCILEELLLDDWKPV